MADHREILQRHFEFLILTLDVDIETPRLLDCLAKNGAIKPAEKDMIKRINERHRRSERLLFILILGPKKLYSEFVKSLNVCDMKFIADKLNDDVTDTTAVTDAVPVNIDNLAERIMRCHETVLEALQAVHWQTVQPYLLQTGIISVPRYKEILIDDADTSNETAYERQRAESLMYLLYREDDKERKLNAFMQAFRRADSPNGLQCYNALEKKIENVNLGETFGYLPCPQISESVQHIPVPSGVRGIAVVDNVVYVVLHMRPFICSFDGDTLRHRQCFTVNDLQWPSDMCHCLSFGDLLFITDRYGKSPETALSQDDSRCPMGSVDSAEPCSASAESCSASAEPCSAPLEITQHEVSDRVCGPGIFIVNIATMKFKFVSSPDGSRPAGLSCTSDGKLVVSFEHPEKTQRHIQLYSMTGDTLVACQDSKFDLTHHLTHYLLQAVHFSDDIYVLSQVQKDAFQHRICMFNVRDFKLVRTFGGSKKSSWPSIVSPWGITKDDHQQLMITNCHFHKIQLLSCDLQFCRDLLNADNVEGFKCPRCMFFDKPTGRLFVGHRWKGKDGRGKVSVQFGAITACKIAQPAETV